MDAPERPRRLFIFDMDGTLLPGSTGLLELAKLFNTTEELIEMEKAYSRGLFTTREFTYAVSAMWGKISDSDARSAFDAAAKIDGIRDCLKAISQDGNLSCLITMSQDVFARHFNEYGFDYIFSTTYPPHTTGDPTILVPADKRRLSQKLCQRHSLDYTKSVAFGDSISDEFLFDDLEETVAVNASSNIRRISKYVYNGSSILDAYRLVSAAEVAE